MGVQPSSIGIISRKNKSSIGINDGLLKQNE